jgi:hypothetical protein
MIRQITLEEFTRDYVDCQWHQFSFGLGVFGCENKCATNIRARNGYDYTPIILAGELDEMEELLRELVSDGSNNWDMQKLNALIRKYRIQYL